MRSYARRMTDAQFAALQFIQRETVRTGRSPLYKQIQVHFGWSSPNAVTSVVSSLKALGALRCSGRGVRHGLEVTAP